MLTERDAKFIVPYLGFSHSSKVGQLDYSVVVTSDVKTLYLNDLKNQTLIMSRIILTILLLGMAYAATAQIQMVSRHVQTKEYNEKIKDYELTGDKYTNNYITWKNGEIKVVCTDCDQKKFTFSVVKLRDVKNPEKSIAIKIYDIITVDDGRKLTAMIMYEDGDLTKISLYDGQMLLIYDALEHF